jgi:hypothetical protein
MDTIAKKFIEQIEKEYNINVKTLIFIENNSIICKNSAKFDFGIIFISDFWKSNIHYCSDNNNCKFGNCNLYSPIGTSEDNNLTTTKIIREILHNYYCVYVYNDDKYIIKTF